MTEGYAVVVRPLPEADGGGFLATVPDLPGCMSDGETREEAVANVADAIDAWLETAKAMGRPIPMPNGAGGAEIRHRLPRSLHAQLTELARVEGVSLNTYVLTLLAKAVGRREAAPPGESH